MTTGAEAVRLNHRRRLGKAAGDCCRVEGFAAERNRLPAFSTQQRTTSGWNRRDVLSSKTRPLSLAVGLAAG
jgi:hypothetical protein